MPILNRIVRKYSKSKILSDFKLGMCLHITYETAVLVTALSRAGAMISLCPANPLSSKDHVIDYLHSEVANVKLFVNNREDYSSFYKNMDRVLDTKPKIITDDGGELHKKAILRSQNVVGGTEETTSGVNRLRMLSKDGKLTYPIIAANESIMKLLLDNKFGTGQSTIQGIINTTGVMVANKRIVVCGYGWVGKGVARVAKGMGAKVTIAEVDPLLAIEAYLDGFEVGPLEKLLANNDIFITCTGQFNVIGRDHFHKLKEGAILCNAGHFDVEIDVNYLNEMDPSHFDPRPNVTCYHTNRSQCKKKFYLITRGRVVNLVGAEGNSPEVMDISFSNQFLAIVYLSKAASKMTNRVYRMPKKLDKKLAQLVLAEHGVEIDSLTPDQISYFKR